MELKKLFGLKLKELRNAKGITQKELSDLAKVDPKHISFIENGKSFPSSELLRTLAEIFKVEVKEFFNFGHTKSKDELMADIVETVYDLDEKRLRLAHRLLFYILMQ